MKGLERVGDMSLFGTQDVDPDGRMAVSVKETLSLRVEDPHPGEVPQVDLPPRGAGHHQIQKLFRFEPFPGHLNEDLVPIPDKEPSGDVEVLSVKSGDHPGET
nr:hypothetical protein [Thermosulfurimonas sp. F29]